MRKWLLVVLLLLLVACSDDKDSNMKKEDTAEKETEQGAENEDVDEEKEPVNQIVVKSKHEQHQEDATNATDYIKILDIYFFDIYENSGDKLGFTAKPGYELEHRELMLQMSKQLLQSYEGLGQDEPLNTLYNKEYQDLINAYRKSLLNGLEKLKSAYYSRYLHEIGDIDSREYSELSNAHYYKRNELYEVRGKTIDYHNQKIAEVKQMDAEAEAKEKEKESSTTEKEKNETDLNENELNVNKIEAE